MSVWKSKSWKTLTIGIASDCAFDLSPRWNIQPLTEKNTVVWFWLMNLPFIVDRVNNLVVYSCLQDMTIPVAKKHKPEIAQKSNQLTVDV